MTREDYVKSLIKARGYSFKSFAQEIDMPYTTLLSILNGSIGGAALDNVLKISGALGVTIEELNQAEHGRQKEKRQQKGEDETLLHLVSSLPPEKKNALKILLSEP